MSAETIFITGTDTGVGKTVLAALLVRHLRAQGRAALGVKPLCSGGREDAECLRAAQGDVLSLEEMNPWHFRAPLAPLVAARREGVTIKQSEMLSYLRRMRARGEVLVIEGAGGLLSPLGEDFNARDLIAALRATPLVACPNRLGAINQALLVMAALPRGAAQRAQVVLISPRRVEASAVSNHELLSAALGPKRVHLLPWLTSAQLAGRADLDPGTRQMLSALVPVF